MSSKLREALLRCDAIAQLPEIREYKIVKEMRNLINGALAEPVRNCEFGTAKEQYKRFDKICSGKHTTEDCPLFEKTKPCCSPLCFAIWSQMPYEKGGVK